MKSKRIKPVKGVAYIYATFEMGPVNPIPRGVEKAKKNEPIDKKTGFEAGPYDPTRDAGKKSEKDGPAAIKIPKFPQIVSIGEKIGDVFTPAVKLGLGDDNRAKDAKITSWASDGSINYYGPYMRPDTHYDFKIKLDMNAGKMTIWVSGRGDVDWFMLAEDKPLIDPVTSINYIEVRNDFDASKIGEIKVLGRKWAEGEKVRPHPLGKKDRVVKPGAGFKFRSMKSTWRKPGKHVTICREEGQHYGFPDVAQVGSKHLVCVWRNASHTGGRWTDSISHSYDLGKTWTPRKDAPSIFSEHGHVPRLRVVKDGRLVMLDDWGGDTCSNCGVNFLDSSDGGKSWTNLRNLNAVEAGGTASSCPSRITELSDGSWLIANSRVIREGKTILWVEIFRSTDHGKTWKFWSDLKSSYPPYGTDEASIVELDDGRLLIFTRGQRNDNLPAVRAFSSDKGKTWDWFESPFQISGRTCAGLLKDGRAMVTHRSGIGRAALWGWVGDPDDMTGFQISSSRINDHQSVGMKDGMLHIDNDGRCGQFTMYNMRPPNTEESVIDFTAEVKVVRNDGFAATLSIPLAGKLRLFSDHIEMAHDKKIRVDVTPGVFHTYRVVTKRGNTKIYVDGELKLDGDFGDYAWGRYILAFGNELCGSVTTMGEVMTSEPDVYLRLISPDTTGYSIWKRVEEKLDDPTTGKWEYSWSAETDGFPDTYQMNHVIEIDASVSGHDQGYSGWIQFDDGRIFVVHYSDDTADESYPPPYHNFGVPWIRGTFLELADLPSIKK